jgi:ubiquitin-protein ligase
MPVNWWEKEQRRLSTEINLMRQKFPQFELGHAEHDHMINNWSVVRKGQKYWLGRLKPVSGNIYTVLLTYPNYYPSGGEIKAYIVSPHISHCNHRYGDGHLCLYSNDHGGKGQGAGPGMTAVSYVGWTAAWLHAHEIYERKGVWPENNFFKRP